MNDDIEILIERYEAVAKDMHITLDILNQSKEACRQIEEIQHFIKNFGGMSEFLELIRTVENSAFCMKEALTTKEAAMFLGMEMSTLYKKTMDNEIPFYSPCQRRLYFKREELVQWMLQNRQATNDEMQAEASLSGLTNMYAPKRNKRQTKKKK